MESINGCSMPVDGQSTDANTSSLIEFIVIDTWVVSEHVFRTCRKPERISHPFRWDVLSVVREQILKLSSLLEIPKSEVIVVESLQG